MPEIKQMMVTQLKDEIRNEIKNELTDAVRREIASSLELDDKHTSEQIKTLTESLHTMETNYKNEVARRNKILMENMRMMKELKTEQNTGFFRRFFSKKKE